MREKKIKIQDEKWVCIYRWRQELLCRAVRNSRIWWHSEKKLFFPLCFFSRSLFSFLVLYSSFFTWIHKKNPINLLVGIEFPVDWTKWNALSAFFSVLVFLLHLCCVVAILVYLVFTWDTYFFITFALLWFSFSHSVAHSGNFKLTDIRFGQMKLATASSKIISGRYMHWVITMRTPIN